jgi:hypothetical protein
MRVRDGMPTPEEWRKIKAEWMHDHGQRHMDDRGVKYEDQAERKLDHDAARGNAAAGPPHPWPSEYNPTGRDRHIQRVVGQIEELRDDYFHCNPERGAFPLGVEERPEDYHRNVMSSSTGWDTWDGLSNAEKEGVLRRYVDWEGFARHHVKEVIGKVICDEPKDRWMEGIRQPSAASLGDEKANGHDAGHSM